MATSSSEFKPTLTREEFTEMVNKLASFNEKLWKWEKSKAELEKYSDDESYKKSMQELILFIEQDKSTSREKAIYLYGQLAQQCFNDLDYNRAGKAYERAALIRFDCSENYNYNDPNVIRDVEMTIQYLEKAIAAYSAIGKLKHVGTLHYRCSRMLRLIGAPHHKVMCHCRKALECFTFDTATELSKLPPLPSLREIRECKNKEKLEWFNEWKKIYLQEQEKKIYNEQSLNSFFEKRQCEGDDKFFKLSMFENQEIYMNSKNDNVLKPSLSVGAISVIGEPSKLQQVNIKQEKSVDEKIESAKKLIKKLKRAFPFYEVITNGSDAGRIWCTTCQRHLGAVSSTLKNHVNTQEHKEASEDTVFPKQNGKLFDEAQFQQLDLESIDLSWLQPQGTGAGAGAGTGVDLTGPVQMIIDSLSNSSIEPS